MSDKTEKGDMELLLQRGEFLRFLLRVIQSAGIFTSTTDGSDSRHFQMEGRRQLGLEILEMAEAAQPQPSPDIPAATLLQVLLEEARKPQTEKPNGRKDRYDRTADLADPDEDPADSA
jgi:hypothetical protein